MSTCVVDFQDMKGDPHEVFDTLMYTPVNLEEGPLWRIRFVKIPSEEKNCHQSVLLLSLHHIVGDGNTAAVLLRDILKIVNALARAEEVIVPWRPFPAATATLHVAQPTSVLSDFFQEVVGMGLHLLRFTRPGNPNRNLTGEPGVKQGRVKVQYWELAESKTTQLTKHCKAAKVSVNCCMSAIARLAMLKLLQECNANKCSSINVAVESCVNMRRYLAPEENNLLGLCLGLERQDFVIHESDASSHESFWNLARKIQEKQNVVLGEGRPATRMLLNKVSHIIVHLNKWLTAHGMRNLPFCHLNTNSMGDLDRQYFNEINATHARITRYVRSFSLEYCPIVCDVKYHTVAGKLLIALDQYTNFLNNELAKKMLSYLVTFTESVAATGAVNWNVCNKV